MDVNPSGGSDDGFSFDPRIIEDTILEGRNVSQLLFIGNIKLILGDSAGALCGIVGQRSPLRLV
jgi:hypothetical protein